MPAVISHHVFGNLIYSRVGTRMFSTEDEMQAFLLGNQGPDPLFFCFFRPESAQIRKLGRNMHARNCAQSFSRMRSYTKLQTLSEFEHAICAAYLKGFLCHFSLDSTAHPFINATARALCSAGIDGLEEADASYVHAHMEADLDSALLKRTCFKTIEDWRPHDHTLIASDEVLAAIDPLYRAAAAGAYQMAIPEGRYSRSLKNYRLLLLAQYLTGGGKRDLVAAFERLGSPHSHFRAASHRTDIGIYSDFDNEEHHEWTNPYTGEASTESFTNLFERAQDIALDNIAAFEAGAPSPALFGGLNFSGGCDQADQYA